MPCASFSRYTLSDELQTISIATTSIDSLRELLDKPARHLSLERQNTLSPPPRYALNPAVLGEGVEHCVDHGVLVAPPDHLALHGVVEWDVRESLARIVLYVRCTQSQHTCDEAVER